MEVTRRDAIRSAAVAGAVATVAAAPVTASADEQADRSGAGGCTWTAAELQDRRRVIAAGLTEDEADTWLLVARVAGKFFSLPELHPSILPEAVQAIHVLQDKLLMRPTFRKYLGLAASVNATTYAR